MGQRSGGKSVVMVTVAETPTFEGLFVYGCVVSCCCWGSFNTFLFHLSLLKLSEGIHVPSATPQ